MIPVSVFVPGVPAAQGSKRAVGRRRNGSTILIEQSANVKHWRAAVHAAVRQFIENTGTPWEPLDGPVVAYLTFFMPRPPSVSAAKRPRPTVSPDVDKLVRAVFDAMTTAGAWADDARVVELHTSEFYDDDHEAGVSIYAEPVPGV